jgi:hypothetical protein
MVTIEVRSMTENISLEGSDPIFRKTIDVWT